MTVSILKVRSTSALVTNNNGRADVRHASTNRCRRDWIEVNSDVAKWIGSRLSISESVRVSSVGNGISSTLEIIPETFEPCVPIIAMLLTRSGYRSTEINDFCALTFQVTLLKSSIIGKFERRSSTTAHVGVLSAK